MEASLGMALYRGQGLGTIRGGGMANPARAASNQVVALRSL
jgi:hypothetical protein